MQVVYTREACALIFGIGRFVTTSLCFTVALYHHYRKLLVTCYAWWDEQSNVSHSSSAFDSHSSQRTSTFAIAFEFFGSTFYTTFYLERNRQPTRKLAYNTLVSLFRYSQSRSHYAPWNPG